MIYLISKELFTKRKKNLIFASDLDDESTKTTKMNTKHFPKDSMTENRTNVTDSTQKVSIVLFDEKRHRDAYKDLNVQWISDLFTVEESDEKVLNHPEKITENGGYIFMAEYEGKPVGTCSLVKTADPKYDFEVAKFAVDNTIRGKGIGKMLMDACIEKAHEKDGKRIFLETNHLLKAAIHLYERFGFIRIPLKHAGHERTDILMEKTIA